ncbi:Hypothetical predicted protein [Cloeon dipterum]|uniref:SID1 transmembrane family member 1 n=1 Tax=Cloeon dipterum TaxID=197152 RepID=A0A8S1D0K9_9INSE|nr:Hypothetical predicted protein [Cloeon dipterum]
MTGKFGRVRDEIFLCSFGRPELQAEFTAFLCGLGCQNWRFFVEKMLMDVSVHIIRQNKCNEKQYVEIGSLTLAALLVKQLDNHRTDAEHTSEKYVALVCKLEQMRSINFSRLSNFVVEQISNKIFNSKQVNCAKLVYLSTALNKKNGDLKSFAWLLLLLLLKKASFVAMTAVSTWPEGMQQLPRPLASAVDPFLSNKDLLKSLALPSLIGSYLVSTMTSDAWLETHFMQTLMPALRGQHASMAMHAIAVALLFRATTFFQSGGANAKVVFFNKLLSQVTGLNNWPLEKLAIRLAKQLLPKKAFKIHMEKGAKQVITIGQPGENFVFKISPSSSDAAGPLSLCYAPLSLPATFARDFESMMLEQKVNNEMTNTFSSVMSMGGSPSCSTHTSHCQPTSSWPPVIAAKRAQEEKKLALPSKPRTDENHAVLITAVSSESESVTKNNPTEVLPKSEDVKQYELVTVILKKLFKPTHGDAHEAAHKLGIIPDDRVLARCLVRFSLEQDFCEWSLLGVVQFASCNDRAPLLELFVLEAASALTLSCPPVQVLRAEALARVVGRFCSERPALQTALLQSSVPLAPVLVQELGLKPLQNDVSPASQSGCKRGAASPPTFVRAPTGKLNNELKEWNGNCQRDIVVVNYDIKKLNVTNPARIHVTKSGNESDPVFVVVRQGRDVVSWDLPYWSMSGQQYNFVARTVCPYMTDSALSVTISSASVHGINVEMHVNVQATYLLTKDRPADTSATPTQPRYFRFEFPPETEVVFVEAVSPNTSCATLFMFKSCSVHQLIEHSNIKESYRQTMTTNGGLMVHRHIYPKGYFYVGFVVHSNDDICSDNDTLTPIDVTPISSPIRVKNITLTIHDITHVESIESLFSLIGFFAVLIAVITLCWLAYTLGGKDCCVNFWTRWLRRRRGDRSVPNSPLTASRDGSERSVADGDTSINQEHGQALDPLSRGANQDNPAQTDSDEVFHEVGVKDMARVKMEKTEEILSKFSNIREMMVSDLCWHNEEALTGVTHLFSWILGVVMIYNGLPVIYMMIVYQLNIHKTGDMDWCYYNFYCAHPLMFFSDFNHIVSNVGYGLLGLFFLVIVKVESWKVKDPECGIPRQFGLYYAMGWSLFAECVCSTCYHICPNRFNFQIGYLIFLHLFATRCLKN